MVEAGFELQPHLTSPVGRQMLQVFVSMGGYSGRRKGTEWEQVPGSPPHLRIVLLMLGLEVATLML